MANTDEPNLRDTYLPKIHFSHDRRRRFPGGWFFLVCIFIPALLVLWLILPLMMVIGDSCRGGVMAAICAGVAIPFGLVSFIVAVVIRDVAIRRGKRFSNWWMLPSVLAFLVPMAIWLAVILKEGGMRLG